MPLDSLSTGAISDLELHVFPGGLAAGAVVGAPTLAVPRWEVQAGGIASSARFGNANPIPVIALAGLASSASVGGVAVFRQVISAAGLPSSLGIGAVNLLPRIQAVGIPSTVAIGAPNPIQIITAAALGPTTAFGDPYMIYSPWTAWQRYCLEGAPQALYLVEVEAFQGGLTLTATDLAVEAIAGAAISSLSDGEEMAAGPAMLTWSDMGWTGEPDDADRANSDYEARAVVPLVMERSIPLYGTARQTVQFGSVELDNGDGALDDAVRGLSVDGREVRVFLGRRGAAFGEMGLLARAKAVEWYASLDRVVVELRDLALDLNIAAAQQHSYAGTGGIEGGEDLAGKAKPSCWGRCFNVSPVLLDPLVELWQVHWRAIQAVEAVRDRGVPLAPGADYPSYDALVEASIPVGHYATCLSLGLIRLGGSPAGTITADVRGDAEGGYTEAIGEIALRFLLAAQGVAAEGIDAESFGGLPSGPAGYFQPVGDTRTADAVLDEMMMGVGAWWGTTRSGLISCGRLADPAGADAPHTLDETNILDFEVVPPPQTPIWRQRVLYRRNWTTQSEVSELVDPALRQAYADSGRLVTAADPNIAMRSLGALDPDPIQSLFADAADAEAEAARILALFGPRRRVLQVVTRGLGYVVDLGDVVTVRHRRLG
ncbi:hypothetical protein, partial [Telmatospirillum sp. J64-1]|uniref:hypothetical protein n=1 Tax=Telmatospirillum sp. J64-1 TaxID=2502183 RepID=UPI00115C6A37